MGFFNDVYAVVERIPLGKVATYGQIARLCGRPRGSQAVGFALHANPRPGEIPCHRVVNRFGRVAPAFAFGGPDAQRKLLELENVEFDAENNVILEKFLWDAHTGEYKNFDEYM